MAFDTSELLITACCTLLGLWLLTRYRRRSRLPYPPGPPGLPLVGNMFDIPNPQEYPEVTYRQWSRQYASDILHVSALGSNIVIANTLEVASELLDKRSAIYSDRPRMVMLNELCGFSWGLAFRPYGEPWRDSRRMAHHDLNQTSVKRFRPQEQKSINNFLLNLNRQQSENPMDQLRHLAAMTIISITYDIDIKSLQDPYILTAEAAGESVSETTTPGSFLVDALPILKYVPEWCPGAGFKTRARQWAEVTNRLLNAPCASTWKRFEAGTLGDCVAKSLIERYSTGTENPQYTDHIIRSTLASLYIGGADTTVSVLGSFFLAMTLYPGLQERARQEIDKVTGSHRLPNFSDRESLPFVDALLRESFRWHLVVPLGVPHRATEDDVYDGYLIPKGTLVVPNIWAMLHDERVYPEPSTYNPDRYLHSDGTLNADVPDPSDTAFGFGRRICPGQYMALDSIWLTIASVLSVFEIKRVVGEDGKEIVPDGEYTRGFLSYPKPFPCVVTPRSKEHEALLVELAAEQEM